MHSKLFVRNLSFSTEEAELTALFSRFGAVRSARVVFDRITGRAKGFGFVEMRNGRSAEAAMNALHRTLFDGRMISVAFSESSASGPNPRNW